MAGDDREQDFRVSVCQIVNSSNQTVMSMKPAIVLTPLSRLLTVTTVVVAWVTVISLGTVDAVAQDADKNKKNEKKVEAEKGLPAGHSNHGEAFNEGPRQKAYLMGGTGNVTFPATCSKPVVQKFINQGVGQLHGFWFFEAERSFRQAAAIDPECAIAYWGMAMANINNEKRAKGFIALAVKRKDKVTERERMYIEAVDAYVKAGSKKNKDRSRTYAKALERISYKYPDDIESKALLGLQLWGNRRKGLPIDSYLAVNALLEQVLAKNPMHPCHHFRIHLWDYEKPDKALNSAARCGQASPGIAHMWRKELAEAKAEAERAIELAPNSAEGYVLLASVADYSGRPEDAIPLFQTAMRFNPHFPGVVLHFYGHAHFMVGR